LSKNTLEPGLTKPIGEYVDYGSMRIFGITSKQFVSMPKNPVKAHDPCPKCGSTNTYPFQWWSKTRGHMVTEWNQLECRTCREVTKPLEKKP
jgi:hypothetical protein